ncbi:MAG: ferredoxin family protein [Deltaproteobacteria bacterium]|nr:ferredoxin family protein [Deltaproteobacteria bacterium]MBW1863429.1 ferredoxin family protein [Deltaproteobacteria bacterium]
MEDSKRFQIPEKKVYALPNWCTPSSPVTFDPDICNGCNQCVDVCQVDILIPNPEKGKPPIVLYPEECWYAGCCEGICPKPGAIQLHLPLTQRVRWKDKVTGEHFRLKHV